MDPDWRFTYINSEAERLLNGGGKNLLGKNAWVEFPTAAGTAYEREYRRAVAEGRPVFFEQFDVPLNAWMEVRAYPSVEGLAVYFRDNTEQRRTRAALVEQAALLDKANDVIVVRDLEHRVLSWNRSAERLYGWSAAEAIGKKTTDLLHTDAAILEAANRELLEKDGWTGELRQRTKDGREVWVECHWSLLRDELGQPTSTLVIAADITARRQANEKLHALLRENTRLVVAVESAPTGILIVDPNQPDLPIIFANSAFCKMTGYEEKEISRAQLSLSPRCGDRPARSRANAPAIAEHRPFRTKLINYKRDGTPFWNSLRINPIWNEAGDLMDYVGIQVDVTEHIEAQEQLRQKQANLALAQRVAHLGSWEQEIIGEGEPCLESLRWSEETYRIFGHEPDAAAPRGTFLRKECIQPTFMPCFQHLRKRTTMANATASTTAFCGRTARNASCMKRRIWSRMRKPERSSRCLARSRTSPSENATRKRCASFPSDFWKRRMPSSGALRVNYTTRPPRSWPPWP